MRRPSQSGQAMVLVAVALLALIGSSALVLLAGSVEWQRTQLQALADSAALDSALVIGNGCSAAGASTVITEADNFLATQRTRTGALAIAAGTCVTPYHGTDTFAGGLSADYYFPYHGHQQQVEVVLTLTLPISFGAEVGKTSTTVSRYAVAQALPAQVPAVSATTLNCTGGQVNVAGDVKTQNAISLSGGCALYAHARTASGSFSSLGDVHVYADGQVWLNAGGACVAGSNAGSTNAICADGSELSGHVTPTCAGATRFLSAADLAVNPNPCAAGVGPQPVAPLSTVLPPEPNTDPSAIATLQGTGGAACTPGAVLPNIVVAGVTVGTGLAPAPVKDASGYYHFKPSCYGYLNLSRLPVTGIARVQAGTVTAVSSGTVRPTLPGASTAGNLLVVTIRETSTATRSTAPAGWTFAAGVNEASAGRVEIWYYANNPGGITTATFTIPGGVTAEAQMTEWSGVATVAPLDRTGTRTVTFNTTTTSVSTTAATTQANELVITSDAYAPNNGETFTPGAGWTSAINSAALGYSSEYRLNLPAAVATETVTYTTSTHWSLAIATFKTGASGPSPAAFDPGFYYFNGSGFAGGGGVCLNGAGKLVGEDVTMEFVNTAGLWTGTCSGGVAACTAGSCSLGSQPCSKSACPPNAPADSPNDYTWLAAPCADPPSALDSASCAGSSWCPVGDRSCWNLLVWAPAAVSGQFSLDDTNADSWLLGTVSYPAACSYFATGTSTIAGAIDCGTLTIEATAANTVAVGSDAGINTAVVEATLVE